MTEPEAIDRRVCRFCGMLVEAAELDDEGDCAICAEISARSDGMYIGAISDFIRHLISVGLEYLHADDIRALVERQIAEGAPYGARPSLPLVEQRGHDLLEARRRRVRVLETPGDEAVQP